MKAFVLTLALLAAAALPAVAADPLRGEEIARQRCAACHAIAPGETSTAANAPAFPTLGGDWPVSALQEALAEGILVGHSDPPMPEFSFTAQEVDDLIAYLESVAAQ